MRVCTVLKHWIEMNREDVTRNLDKITHFVETEMKQPELKGLVDRLKALMSSAKTDQTYHFLESPPEPLVSELKTRKYSQFHNSCREMS